MFRGEPGTGKTSAAYKMFPGVFHVENDMYLMHDGKYEWSRDGVKDAISWCRRMAKTALENGLDVVVANTFTKKKYVASYEKLALEHGAEFEVYRCTGNFKNVHGLDQEMVQSF